MISSVSFSGLGGCELCVAKVTTSIINPERSVGTKVKNTSHSFVGGTMVIAPSDTERAIDPRITVPKPVSMEAMDPGPFARFQKIPQTTAQKRQAKRRVNPKIIRSYSPVARRDIPMQKAPIPTTR